ncbi:hypothetical protein BGZ93_007951 [Podila epicladia]|nr:hypothetical protein BGZ93_007951 [Podila epicladia]
MSSDPTVTTDTQPQFPNHQQQQHHQPQPPSTPAINTTPTTNTNANTTTPTTPTNTASMELATDQPKKAKRKRITTEQLEHLVGLFEKTDTPSFEIRESLAKKLGMSNREIQVWFQNRRAKANRVKINEQAALHHQQHLQHQQMQQQQQHHHHQQHQQHQHLQGHHHLHSRPSNGFSPHGPSHHVHSAPSTPLQAIPIHQSPSQTNTHGTQESTYGYFGPNGASPPMVMPTPTPRTHSHANSAHGGRRPASLYNIGSYGHLLQTQQFQQQHSSQKQPFHQSSPSGYTYGTTVRDSARDSYASSSMGMDIILPSAVASPPSSSQRPLVLPPPITTLQQQHSYRSGQLPAEDFEEHRRPRHERTMSEGHPSGYMSPSSVSPTSPTGHYRDDYKQESPPPAHPALFSNGDVKHGQSSSNGASNRHSTASLTSFGLKAMSLDHHRSSSTEEREREHESERFISQPKSRRSCDDAVMYDEHQQLMRDNFNMDTRLVISEDEPRPESAIDLLAYAAAYIQESEEHKKEGGSGGEDKRDSLGRLNSSNKRQSFHGAGYSSKEPFSSFSNNSSGNGMTWETSKSASPSSSSSVMDGSSITTNPVVIPRSRDGMSDGPYAPARRPRPVTYGGSGYLYDHHENAFIQSPSSSLASYGRSSSSSNSRRQNNRNSTDTTSLLLSRGLTRPRRSSSTAASGMMHHPPSSSVPVLPPIMNDGRRLSPGMAVSPSFGSSRHSRHDSNQGGLGHAISNGFGNGVSRDSPGSDSLISRDSYTNRSDLESHNTTDRDEVEEDDEMMDDDEAEFHRLRAAKRRSGNSNSFFGMSGK